MTKILSFIVSLVIGILLGLYVDSKIVNIILHSIPSEYSSWLGFIKIISWFFIIWFTFGLIFFLSWCLGLIITSIYEIFFEK